METIGAYLERAKVNFKENRIIRGLYFSIKRIFPPSKSKYGNYGKHVIITPPISLGNPSNVFIGDNVGIGPYAFISAVRSKFVVKGQCAIADHLTVHKGNHARILGKYVTDVTEQNKPEGYDKDVIIEEDVWIGCNVTILSGIRIGRGSTIAAGAVVNKNIPPYCIAGGVPAKVIKFYWTVEEIIRHEQQLYPESERLSKDYLQSIIGINN
mgnify:CR=1 FL=1